MAGRSCRTLSSIGWEYPNLALARDFVEEVKINLQQWRKRFLDASERAGQETFRPALSGARALWAQCEARWGAGPGYRIAMASYIRDWFDEPSRRRLHVSLELRIREAWNEHVVQPLQELCGDSEFRAKTGPTFQRGSLTVPVAQERVERDMVSDLRTVEHDAQNS